MSDAREALRDKIADLIVEIAYNEGDWERGEADLVTEVGWADRILALLDAQEPVAWSDARRLAALLDEAYCQGVAKHPYSALDEARAFLCPNPEPKP